MSPWTVRGPANVCVSFLAVLLQLGVVHRDLKANNVFLTSEKPLKVVVGDFGLSHALQPVSESGTLL